MGTVELMAYNLIPETELQALIDQLPSFPTVSAMLKANKINIDAFYASLKAVPSLQLNYDHARDLQMDVVADSIIEIADDPDKNYNQARNQIDARKWIASKVRPGKYGDRIDLNVNQNVNIALALDAAKNRIRDVIIETHNLLSLSEGDKPNEPMLQNEPPISQLEDLLK